MQEKSEEKYSSAIRLKKVHEMSRLKWDQIAVELEVKPAMIYAVIAGKRELGPKPLFRLGKLEGKMGIKYIEPRTEYIIHHDEFGSVREVPAPEDPIDQVLAQVDRVREEMKALDRAVERLRSERRRGKPVSSAPTSEAEELLDAADEEDRRRHPGSQH